MTWCNNLPSVLDTNLLRPRTPWLKKFITIKCLMTTMVASSLTSNRLIPSWKIQWAQISHRCCRRANCILCSSSSRARTIAQLLMSLGQSYHHQGSNLDNRNTGSKLSQWVQEVMKKKALLEVLPIPQPLVRCHKCKVITHLTQRRRAPYWLQRKAQVSFSAARLVTQE